MPKSRCGNVQCVFALIYATMFQDGTFGKHANHDWQVMAPNMHCKLFMVRPFVYVTIFAEITCSLPNVKVELRVPSWRHVYADYDKCIYFFYNLSFQSPTF